MNENQWLKKHYQFDNLNSIESISYFTLIWNIFEKKCCAGNAKIHDCVEKIASSDVLEKIALDPMFNYFRDRYIDIHKKDKKDFENFEFKSEKLKEKVRNFFIKKPTKIEKIKALLYIAFRLRNNLYHGEKEVSNLHEQNENFKQINRTLITIIDNYSY